MHVLSIQPFVFERQAVKCTWWLRTQGTRLLVIWCTGFIGEDKSEVNEYTSFMVKGKVEVFPVLN